MDVHEILFGWLFSSRCGTCQHRILESAVLFYLKLFYVRLNALFLGKLVSLSDSNFKFNLKICQYLSLCQIANGKCSNYITEIVKVKFGTSKTKITCSSA